MATIEKQDPVALSQNWGVTFSDYKADGKAVANVDLKSHICWRYQFSYMEFQCKSGAVSPTVI